MDLMNLVSSGAQFKVEVTGYDLMQFADNLIKRAMEEQRILDATRQQQEAALPTGDGETYLTSQEAAKMCNVCITTLWSWAKAGYLVPCKIGRSNRYALSDIKRLMANHGADETKVKKGFVPMNKVQQELARKAANQGL